MAMGSDPLTPLTPPIAPFLDTALSLGTFLTINTNDYKYLTLAQNLYYLD